MQIFLWMWLVGKEIKWHKWNTSNSLFPALNERLKAQQDVGHLYFNFISIFYQISSFLPLKYFFFNAFREMMTSSTTVARLIQICDRPWLSALEWYPAPYHHWQNLWYNTIQTCISLHQLPVRVTSSALLTRKSLPNSFTVL